ncbi:Hint domain-containing protein [Pseudodonghicola flavimaris]|uniref:Hint domain-containing protein n=1 Tax=Pseudodonghicola flavimaris TaxID=3050036 RepID=A0ABT7F7T2_9RHOB|nr:Hint domain-containing protein [Pseudodonghicola flavimaris]MDK3020667.1 Hint domain-containing protein [Pseudodonghicola flavimaris]
MAVTPRTPNGIVEGDSGNNKIDLTYTGDPDGDVIDGGDAVLAGEGPNDDIVDAGAGDDYIEAGLGDDTVYAGSGSDEVYGQEGDDVLYGDSNYNDGAPTASREVLQWDLAPDPDDGGATPIDVNDSLKGGFTQNTGSVDVTFSVSSADWGTVTALSAETENVDDIVTDGTPASTTSGLDSLTQGEGNSVAYNVDFSEEVENISFRVNDIDGDGVVKIEAYDAQGNPVEVTLTAGANLTLLDTDTVTGPDTADSNGGYDDNDSADYSVLVSIDGPVASLSITHSQDGANNSGVTVTDIYFDAGTGCVDDGEDGDDYIDGGEGDDTIYGEGGNDTLIGGDGSDTVYGGEGDDFIDTSSTSGIPLPDRGFPSYEGLPPIPADADPTDDMDFVDGGDGNDTIITGDDDDIIYGGAGNDVIDAGLDDDYIEGGDGDDFIVGGEGSDEIHGGDGDDTIYGGLDPAYPDYMNIPDDGSAGDPDPVTDNGMDVIYGGAGNDTIYGQDDDDYIEGGDGDDYIDGGVDDDTLLGGAGSDTLIGGQGSDTMSGGDDRDSFYGVTDGDDVDGGAGGDDYDTLYMGGQRFKITSETVDADGNSTSGTMNLLDDFGNVTGSIDFHEIEKIVPCFTPGTRIATPQGARLVEELEIGDQVLTRDNGIQQIRWVGRRDLQAAEMADHLQPILIRQGALGNGLPDRDMMVSPQHRVLIASDRTSLYFEDREVLVAAKHLTWMDGVDQVARPDVTYIHFMFDHHEVVLSDGAWTESFQPGDLSLNGMDSAQRMEILELFPELKTRDGLAAYPSARRSLKRHEAVLLMH